MEKGIVKKLDRRFGKSRFYQLIKELMRRIKEDRVSAVGAQLAYYLVLSFFPFLLFLLTLVPYTPLANQDVLSQLLASMPSDTRNLIQPILEDIISQRSVALLSTALFFALWSGSSGMGNLLEAMGAAFDITNARSAIIKRIFAVLFTIMLAVIILLAMVSQVFGDQIVNAIISRVNLDVATSTITTVWNITRTVLPLIVMILGFGLLFKFGPGFPVNFKVTFKEALLGGVFTAVTWTLISLGFSFYVDNFGNYSRTYGSLGGIIILLIWLYLSSVVIMVGAELNASYVAVYKGGFENRNTQMNEVGDPARDRKRGDASARNEPLQPGKSIEEPSTLGRPSAGAQKPAVPGTGKTERRPEGPTGESDRTGRRSAGARGEAGARSTAVRSSEQGTANAPDEAAAPVFPALPDPNAPPELDFGKRQLGLGEVVATSASGRVASRGRSVNRPRRSAVTPEPEVDVASRFPSARSAKLPSRGPSRVEAQARNAGYPARPTPRPSELFSRSQEKERALSTLLTAGLMFWILKKKK